jgi:hypothetical protein
MEAPTKPKSLLIGRTLPPPPDGLGKLGRRFAQAGKLMVMAADQSCIEIVTQAMAYFGGPPDPKSLLKSFVVVSARGAEQAPEPQPKVVECALEVFQSFDGCLSFRDTGFNATQGRIENSDLIAKAQVRHDILAQDALPIRNGAFNRTAPRRSAMIVIFQWGW